MHLQLDHRQEHQNSSLQHSWSCLPRNNFARFILMNFIIYYFVIRTVYQGGIYNIIKSRQRKPELASIDEIMEKNYDFYLYETFANRAQHMKFYDRRKVFPNDEINTYRKKTLDPSFRGVVFNYVNQIVYENEKNYKNYSFQICKEILMTNSFVFYFRKNHHIVDEVSLHIDLMLTAGIIQHIEKRYMNEIFRKVNKDEMGPKQLTLKHFIGTFRFLLMFNSIASAVFLLELLTRIKRLKFTMKMFLRKPK
jgi:hypothetical protein